MEKKRALIYTTDVSEGDSAGNKDVLVEAEHIRDGLHSLGYSDGEIVRLPFIFDTDNYDGSKERVRREIFERNPLYVVNLVEALRGTDGSLTDRLVGFAPRIFHELKLPYTGNPLIAFEKTESKIKAKEIMIANKISTPDYMTLQTLREIKAGEKFILKSAYENGSEGLIEEETSNGRVIKLFDDADKIKSVLELNPKYFAERFVGDREFNVSIMGSKGNYFVLPIP